MAKISALKLDQLVQRWTRKRDPLQPERYQLVKNRIRIRYHPKTSRAYVALNFRVKKEKGANYQVVLGFPLDGSNRIQQMLQAQGARISCSCPDFVYRQAYLYHQSGHLYGPANVGLAAKLPPLRTNPHFRKRACKHVKMVWELIREKKFTDLYARSLRAEVTLKPKE